MSINNSLAACVSSLQSCTTSLASSIGILHGGVRDLPRTKRVIDITRHFELVSEQSLFAAQRALAAEIGPEVAHLLRRVDEHLARLDRREKALVSRSELLEQRIARLHPPPPAPPSQGAPDGGAAAAAQQRAERLRLLRNRRERLQHAVERLTLQASHKARQLRMSLNYGAR